MRLSPTGVVALSALCLWSFAVAAGEYPIAGTTPDHRPEGAPVIHEVVKDEAWYDHALRGVEQPYPPSVLRFLEDQGDWYTPFTRPGMTGRYDIRGWHGPTS